MINTFKWKQKTIIETVKKKGFWLLKITKKTKAFVYYVIKVPHLSYRDEEIGQPFLDPPENYNGPNKHIEMIKLKRMVIPRRSLNFPISMTYVGITSSSSWPSSLKTFSKTSLLARFQNFRTEFYVLPDTQNNRSTLNKED